MSRISKSLLWDVTDNCNLQCIHCYNAGKYPLARAPLNVRNDYQSIIDRLLDLGINHIHLLGGEPLLTTGLTELLGYTGQRNMIVTINTNGTCLDAEMVKKLIHYGVAQITISLDGATELDNDAIRGQGVFSLVTQNMEHAASEILKRQSPMVLQVASVVTKKNMANLHLMPRLIASLGVYIWDVLYLYQVGSAIANKAEIGVSSQEFLNCIKKLLLAGLKNKVFIQFDCKSKVLTTLARQYGIPIDANPEFDACSAGKRLIFMDCYGDLYPCGPCANQADTRGKAPWMNLYDLNYMECWDVFQNFVENRVLKATRKIAVCSNCDRIQECSSCSLCSAPYFELCELVKK